MVRVKGHVSLVIHKHRAHIVLSSKWNGNVCVCILTDICCALGDGEIGSSAPSSGLIIPLTAATVRPRSVVLTLTSQFLFVKDAAVGMKVALAPVTVKKKKKGNKTYALVDFQLWSSITPERGEKNWNQHLETRVTL